MGHTRFNNWEFTPKQSQLELSFLYVTGLLNVPYILVKYHENILKGFQSYGLHNILQFWEITDLRVVILARDTPTQCPLQPDKVS